jgi:hypothetical protein
MDQVRPQLPFCSKFYDCKLLQMLYLFVSQQSVNLKAWVMLTDKTEHFGVVWSSAFRLHFGKSELKLELQTQGRPA